MKKIILTGGGTAGHVTPNLALLPGLKELGYDIFYIGSEKGIEKSLMEAENIRYYSVPTGKFRRNLSRENIKDFGRIFKGIHEARAILKKEKPDVLFSKGGFVGAPVVAAANELHIPIILHESDMTPGLANKLCFRAAKKICCNFPETVSLLPKGKGVWSGSPIRKELLEGSKEKGYAYTGLSDEKPILLMIGGSLGAQKLNEILRKALPLLLPDFQVLHLCGKGNLDETYSETPGYVQFEYISSELKDLFAISDLVFSRAGANAICELLALHKPAILTPLPKGASRGDQILNAESFEKQGFSKMILQENLSPEVLNSAVRKVYQDREKYIQAMEKTQQSNGVDAVLKLIQEYTR